MTGCGSVALQQFHHANHQQDGWPGAIEAGDTEALEQQQSSDRQKHDRPHDPSHAAAVAAAVQSDSFAHAAGCASAAHGMNSDHSPLPGEHPGSQADQNERPETVEAELPDVHGVQQEEHAESNQDDRNGGNILGLSLLSHAEGLSQTEWIWRGLAGLKSVSRAYGIDNLVDVKECDGDAEQRIPTSGVIGGEDEQSEDEQVGQSLGVLRAVDGADAEGKESSEDAGDCGIWTGVRRARGGRRCHRRIDSLRRHESGCRDGAFQTGCETRLAVDNSANVAGAIAAERRLSVWL